MVCNETKSVYDKDKNTTNNNQDCVDVISRVQGLFRATKCFLANIQFDGVPCGLGYMAGSMVAQTFSIEMPLGWSRAL